MNDVSPSPQPASWNLRSSLVGVGGVLLMIVGLYLMWPADPATRLAVGPFDITTFDRLEWVDEPGAILPANTGVDPPGLALMRWKVEYTDNPERGIEFRTADLRIDTDWSYGGNRVVKVATLAASNDDMGMQGLYLVDPGNRLVDMAITDRSPQPIADFTTLAERLRLLPHLMSPTQTVSIGEQWAHESRYEFPDHVGGTLIYRASMEFLGIARVRGRKFAVVGVDFDTALEGLLHADESSGESPQGTIQHESRVMGSGALYFDPRTGMLVGGAHDTINRRVERLRLWFDDTGQRRETDLSEPSVRLREVFAILER